MMHFRYFFKLVLLCTVVLSLWLNFNVLSISASADTNDVSPNSVSFTEADLEFVPNDACNQDGYHVYVNIRHLTVGLLPYLVYPISWELEWEMLGPDHSLVNRGTSSDVIYTTVASQKVDLYCHMLKYGYFRCRLTTVNANGEKKTSDWKEISVGHSSSGGHHRIRRG